MSESHSAEQVATCTGALRGQYHDDEWAHWMFLCDADCPMEVRFRMALEGSHG